MFVFDYGKFLFQLVLLVLNYQLDNFNGYQELVNYLDSFCD